MGLVLDLVILAALLAWAIWALLRLRRRRGKRKTEMLAVFVLGGKNFAIEIKFVELLR